MSAQVKPSKKEGFIARALNSVERVGNALPMKIIIVGGVAGGASAAADSTETTNTPKSYWWKGTSPLQLWSSLLY